MTPLPAPTRSLGRLAGVVVVTLAAAVASLLPAASAAAHNQVVTVSPAAGSTQTGQPGVIVLTTNDALLQLRDGTAMQVVGPDGKYYERSCPTVSGVRATVSVLLGPPGRYQVTWRVVSGDGHPISGDWWFQYQPAAAGTPAATPGALPAGSAQSACRPAGDTVLPGTLDQPLAGPLGVPTDVWWGTGVTAAVIVVAVGVVLVARRSGRG